jgi:uncharacterized membrane protein (DUF373 family)
VTHPICAAGCFYWISNFRGEGNDQMAANVRTHDHPVSHLHDGPHYSDFNDRTGLSACQGHCQPAGFFLEIDELLELFGFFLLIIIGIELLETIKAYLQDKVVHSEIVLEVALIAIARKVIILDLKEYDSVVILGIAALIVTISVSYYIVRRKLRIDLSTCDPNQR